MKFDALIVLGYGSQENILSEIAKKRLEKGIELYKKEKSKIIMSGGFSLSYKKDPGFREAELMKKYAIKSGIPSYDILTEEESRDTQGNAYFTKQIVKSNLWKKIAVITSDFHIKKAKFFFDFIFGEGYKIHYFGIDSNHTKKELKDIAEKEKESIDIMINLYQENKIKKGDDKQVGVLLKNFYNSRLK